MFSEKQEKIYRKWFKVNTPINWAKFEERWSPMSKALLIEMEKIKFAKMDENKIITLDPEYDKVKDEELERRERQEESLISKGKFYQPEPSSKAPTQADIVGKKGRL